MESKHDHDQIRRWLGNHKIRYASPKVDVLELNGVPPPFDGVLAAVGETTASNPAASFDRLAPSVDRYPVHMPGVSTHSATSRSRPLPETGGFCSSLPSA